MAGFVDVAEINRINAELDRLQVLADRPPMTGQRLRVSKAIIRAAPASALKVEARELFTEVEGLREALAELCRIVVEREA